MSIPAQRTSISSLALIAALAALASILVSTAEARSRKPLRITVQPRSYLDAGKVVPTGSLSNYATTSRYSAPTSVVTGPNRAEQSLPSYIGSGRNPFGSFDWPGGR